MISTTADGTKSVFAADLDGDGDTDVLSASNADHKIAWYENAARRIPTVFEWGLIMLTLVLLTVAKIVYTKRRCAAR